MLCRWACEINSCQSDPITSNAPSRLSASASNVVWSRVSSATSIRMASSRKFRCAFPSTPSQFPSYLCAEKAGHNKPLLIPSL